MKYTVRAPKLLQAVYGKRLWRLPASEKVLYLTFDDGPVPEVTPWVLEQLAAYKAKATFFCIGDNIRKHPEVFQQVLNAGHRIGNHTQHHVKGWKTTPTEYLEEVALCQTEILNAGARSEDKLFRPPYGQLRSKQSRQLQRLGYKIVMWDILSADFDTDLDGDACMENVLTYSKPGSIIVFHDSIKAQPRLEVALPAILKSFSEKGYEFRCIP